MLKPDGHGSYHDAGNGLDAHKLIEEFMILANVAAAETLERALTPLDLSRPMTSRDRRKFESLREFLGLIELSLPKGQTYCHTTQFELYSQA